MAGFDSIGVVSGSDAGETERIVDGFRDPGPPAGQLVEYTVTARTDRRTIEARAVQVQVPGASLLRLRRNPFEGRIQVDWRASGTDLQAFEVIRSTGGEDATLAVTGPDARSFVDADIEGDTEYAYRIRTLQDGGVALVSQVMTASVYDLRRTERPGTPGDRLALAPGSGASAVTALALTASEDGIDIHKYRYFFGAAFDGRQTIGAIREETVPIFLTNVAGASLTVAGPSVFLPPSANTHLLLAGRNGTSQAVIRAFDLPDLTPRWDGPSDWPLDTSGTPVVATQAGDGNYYFAAGSDLRVYTSSLFEIGSFDLPFDSVLDLDGGTALLWAVVAGENRVYRADIASGPPTAWEVVDFPVAGLTPTALTLNTRGQVLILDAPAGVLQVFGADLEHVLSVPLPAGAYEGGALTLDGGTGDLVHVGDDLGHVYTYLP